MVTPVAWIDTDDRRWGSVLYCPHGAEGSQSRVLSPLLFDCRVLTLIKVCHRSREMDVANFESNLNADIELVAPRERQVRVSGRKREVKRVTEKPRGHGRETRF